MNPIHTHIKKFGVVVSTSGVTCKWCGFGETMVFKAKENGGIANFDGLATHRFDPTKCLQEEHNKVVALAESCSDVNEFIEKINELEY